MSSKKTKVKKRRSLRDVQSMWALGGSQPSDMHHNLHLSEGRGHMEAPLSTVTSPPGNEPPPPPPGNEPPPPPPGNEPPPPETPPPTNQGVVTFPPDEPQQNDGNDQNDNDQDDNDQDDNDQDDNDQDDNDQDDQDDPNKNSSNDDDDTDNDDDSDDDDALPVVPPKQKHLRVVLLSPNTQPGEKESDNTLERLIEDANLPPLVIAGLGEDMQRRLAYLRSILAAEHGRDHAEESAKRLNDDPVQRVLIAPEWFFRRVRTEDNRPMGLDELGVLQDALKQISQQYDNWVIIPGTIFFTPSPAGSEKYKVLNTAPILYGGNLQTATKLNQADYLEKDEEWGGQDAEWAGQTFRFTINGTRFAVEICKDHFMRAAFMASPDLVDVHIVVSNDVRPSAKGVVARDGGMLLWADGKFSWAQAYHVERPKPLSRDAWQASRNRERIVQVAEIGDDLERQTKEASEQRAKNAEKIEQITTQIGGQSIIRKIRFKLLAPSWQQRALMAELQRLNEQNDDLAKRINWLNGMRRAADDERQALIEALNNATGQNDVKIVKVDSGQATKGVRSPDKVLTFKEDRHAGGTP